MWERLLTPAQPLLPSHPSQFPVEPTEAREPNFVQWAKKMTMPFLAFLSGIEIIFFLKIL